MRLPRRVRVDEVLDLGARATVACHRYERDAYRPWWHAHRELEMVVVLRGRGTREVGDSIEPCGPGEVVLVGSGTPHSWTIEGADGGRADCCYAQFDGAALLSAARALGELSALAPLFDAARRGLVAPPSAPPRASAAMLALHRRSADPLARLSHLCAALACFGDGARCRALCPPAYAPVATDARLARLQRFLCEHRHDPVPAASAAAIAGVPASSFSRFFTKAFRRGYLAYRTELRISDACRLLAEGDRPVSMIALDAGFANLANFNRRFRQAKGMTPSAYRLATRHVQHPPIPRGG